ncbi:MAG: hypothetical protein K2N13_08205 [Paraprevotella sp.]|nr:hypothetical protein [Paraprevotella sp.]
MKTKPTWEDFRHKYPGEELQRTRFEDLVRILFCHRMGIRYGLFQYYNHAGNETETMRDGNEVVGFQAKYFLKTIDKNKILESLQTAHKNHADQTKQIIYINITFGNPPKNKKKTGIQQEIENKAAVLGMKVEWVTDQMILDQVMQVEWVYDFFFGTAPNSATLIQEETENAETILNPIENQINTTGRPLRIDRTDLVQKLYEGISQGNHLVLHGEGGCGKTAILKDFYRQYATTEIPVCIRKAQSFDTLHVTELFRFTYSYNLTQFQATYADREKKVFVIDSAERLQELEDTDSLQHIVTTLAANGWSIVFTVRDVYLNELKDQIAYLFHLKCEYMPVNNLSSEQLQDIALQEQIPLPDNENFRDRLRNLFHLKIYVRITASGDTTSTYHTFMQKAWDYVIAGQQKKNGIHFKRSKTFKDIVKTRMLTGRFWLNPDEYTDCADALHALQTDEVVALHSRGLFITHDIYEEWGISRILNDEWEDKSSIQDFFHRIGTSYLTRRIFRLWLSNKIDENESDISSLLREYRNPDIVPFWRDEIIVSVLHSSHAEHFITHEETYLLSDHARLLNRMLYLLRLSCKRLVKLVPLKGHEYPIYEPEGKGWEAVIAFLFRTKDLPYTANYLTDILHDWCQCHLSGITTRQAGLTALHLWAETEKGNSYINSKDKEILARTVCCAAAEIKTELTDLIDKVIQNEWFWSNRPYYALCQFILSRPSESYPLLMAMPEDVIRLAWAFWKDTPDKEEDEWHAHRWDNYDGFGIRYEGLDNDYSPAGAMQTPMYWLLRIQPKAALQFFTDFVNYVTEQLRKSERYGKEIQEISLPFPDAEPRVQYGTHYLWSLYRGGIYINTPDLYQSLHMAVEKYLLELAYSGKDEQVKYIFHLLLSRSQSVSVTGLVASVIQAHPDRYAEYALLLFHVPEFFHWDTLRCQHESRMDTIYRMDAFRNKTVGEERIATLQQPFRKRHLEGLFTEYQYSNLVEEADRPFLLEKLYTLLDRLYAEAEILPEDEKQKRFCLLYRIDRRKHAPRISKTDDKHVIVELNPQFPQALQDYREKAQELLLAPLRFTDLMLWADCRFQQKEACRQYTAYEDHPAQVIQDIKQLQAALEAGEELTPMDDRIPYMAAAILIRDYAESLSAEERDFCKQLIERCVTEAFEDTYSPSLSDGLEMCLHAFPRLAQLYSDDRTPYAGIMGFLLLKSTIQETYRNMRDYIVNALSKEKVWDTDRTFAENVFCSYLSGVSAIDEVIGRHRKSASQTSSWGTPLYSMKNVLKDVAQELADTDTVFSENLLPQVNRLSVEKATTLLFLVPADSDDPLLRQFVLHLAPILTRTLHDEKGNRLRNYHDRNELYRLLARYILHRNTEDTTTLLAPYLEHLSGNRYGQYFLQAFIYEEERLQRPEQFWNVWRQLYPTVTARTTERGDQLMQNYLLDIIKSPANEPWHSFNTDNLWLYAETAQNYGHIPCVLYATAKALNHHAASYAEQGIDWLYDITSAHPALCLRERESATIFYMECFLNPYIRTQRPVIKNNRKLKQKLITILTFMTERNSSQAYTLRDTIA